VGFPVAIHVNVLNQSLCHNSVSYAKPVLTVKLDLIFFGSIAKQHAFTSRAIPRSQVAMGPSVANDIFWNMLCGVFFLSF